MTAIHDMTAAALAAAIRGREVSSVEALAALQQRIDAVNPAINAIPPLARIGACRLLAAAIGAPARVPATCAPVAIAQPRP